MKTSVHPAPKSVLAIVLLSVGIACLAFAPLARAADADQTWNTSGPTNNWNTTDLNWDSGDAWGANNNAIFAGTGETVTVGTVAANAITFNSTGYVLNTGTITLGAATTPITANANATINAILAFGTNTLSTAGTGTLTLGGANTGTGPVNVTAGTLKLGIASALGTSSLVTVSSGATLDTAGLAVARPLTISGTGAGTNPALYNSSSTAGSAITSLTLGGAASIGNGSTDRSFIMGITTLNLASNKLTIAKGAVSVPIQSIPSGDIDISNTGSLLSEGTSTTAVTGTITVNTGGRFEGRDTNNTGAATVHTIALNGGRLSTATITNNNGGGGGTLLKNPITVDATNGGIIDGNNTGFGIYLRLAGSVSGSGPLTLQGGKGVEFQGDCSSYTGTATATAGTVSFNTAVAQAFNGKLAGSRPVTKSGAGTTTLGGDLSFTGLTTLSAGGLVLTGTNTTATGALTMSAGTTLKLDYTNDTKKIPGGVLTLSGGAIELAGSALSVFADSVTSTTLAAGTASTIARTSGGATLDLKTITPGAGSLLTLAQSGIAKTTNANNAGGTLGAWAMVGTDLAMNDGSGNIVAYTGFIPVTRLDSGTKTISDGAATNIQIVEGTGLPGDILLGSPVTTISTLNQSATGGTAVIDPAGQTLAVDTVMVGTGAASLTIGNGTNNGTLKSAGTALGFRDLAGAGITINSVIADGTGISSLTKWDAGALVLTASNTYTGATTIGGGSLALSGAGALNDASAVNASASGTSFNISGISASSETIGSIAGAAGSSVVLGGKNLTAGGNNTSTTLAGVISGVGGSLTKAGTGALTLSSANTYTGNTIVSAGTLILGNGTAMGVVQTNKPATQITVASGATVSLNAIAATYGYTIAGTGVGGNGAIVNNSGTAIGTGAAQTSNIKLSANASVGGSGSWCLLTNSYAATTLDLGGYTLTKSGAGTFTLANTTATAGAITVAGGVLATYNTAPNLSAAALTLNNTAGVSLTPATALSIGSLAGGGTTGGGISLGANTLTMGALGTNTAYAGVIAGTATAAGSAIVKVGAGTQTLSGANTYTGTTTISGGTLALDYATQNNSKLADASALIFNGTSGLSLNNGSHTETVLSTTLNAGANVTISRPSGTGVLQMNAITRNAGATLNFTAPNIATTDTPNNASGILGNWATVGNDFAKNSTGGSDGLITAYTGYADVTRLESGPKTIGDATASNVRIIEGTGSTLASNTLTTTPTNINTLLQSGEGGSSAAMVALPSQKLRLGTSGAIMASTDSGALTIGTGVNEGTLTAGGNADNVAGDIAIINSSPNPLTINSVIANNGSGVVTLTKGGSGSAVLAGTNTYTGTTTVSGGTLEVKAKSGDSTYVVNHGATLYFGYSTGGGYATTGMTLYGDGVAATTGFYLAGGKTYNVSGGFTVNDAPTTIRQYGTGLATVNIFDINTNPGLNITAAASGSVVDSNIQFTAGGYGMVVTTAPGANTATGDLVMNGPLNVSTNGFYKRGTGSMVLNGTSGTSTSAINLQGGTLIAGASNALGVNAALNISSGTKLIVGNGTAQTVASMSNAGTITGGSATLSTLTVSGSAASTSTGAIGGTGANENNLALAKAGTGLLTLSTATNTYAGGTTVNGGTLRVTNTSGSATGTGPVTINGAILDGSGTVSGAVSVSATGGTITAGNAGSGNLKLGSLTFAGTGTINVQPGVTQIQVTGALTASGAGSVTVNLGTTPLLPGTYTLVTHTGGVANATPFTSGTTPGGAFTYSLEDDGTALKVKVETSALVWSGSADTEWSTTTSKNNWWTPPVPPGTPAYYSDTNDVVFDDNAAGASPVTVDLSLVGVSPGSVTFGNSSKDYILSGFYGIAGTTGLLKGGTGTLTVSSIHSFTGGVSISNGTLSVDSIANNGTNSPLGAGTLLTFSGGKLAYTGAVGASTDRTVSVPGVNPALIEVSDGATALTLTGPITGTGGLTKSGSGELILTSDSNAYTGVVTVNGGKLTVGDGGTTGVLGGAGDVTIASGATLAYNRSDTTTMIVPATRIIKGAGKMEYNGTGTLTLQGHHTFTGGLTVNSGTVRLFNNDNGWYLSPPCGTGLLTINAPGVVVNASVHAFGGGYSPTQDILLSGGTFQLADGTYVDDITMVGGLIENINGFTGGLTAQGGGNTTFTVDESATPSVVKSPISAGVGSITFVVNDLDTPFVYEGAISGGMAFTKSGAGTMRLTGVNTYTGNISVNAGTLELAQDAQLKFVIGANGVANKITGTTGTGMVSLDGKFNLDISGANTTTGNQWLLVDVDNLFENFGPNFRLLVGAAEFTPASGVHTLIVGSKKWTFTEATGILSVAPSSAYQSWADANAGGQTAEKDYDGDGVANGVEWVVGGSGTTNDLARLPAVAAVGGDMTFTFKRDRRSISPETTVAITVGTTLAAWPDSYPVEATSSGAVTVSDNGDGTDTITLTVVRAPDVHKFARLEVTITAP